MRLVKSKETHCISVDHCTLANLFFVSITGLKKDYYESLETAKNLPSLDNVICLLYTSDAADE